jgi:Fe-S cluster assembly protein SufD
MAKRTPIVIKKGRGRSSELGEFSFSKEMIPVFSNGSKEPGFLTDYRDKAWQAHQNLNMPDPKDEPWRRTDLRRLKAEVFKPLNHSEGIDIPSVPIELLKPLAGDHHAGQIILSPGETNITIDPEVEKKGVIFTDFTTAAHQYPEILKLILGQIVRVDEGKFAAIAGAFSSQGLLLYVPQGVDVKYPFHSVLWGPGERLAHFSHVLVWVEEQASVTFVHENASPNQADQTMHAGIVELFIGRGANLRFVELQSWGKNVWNFTHERAKVEADGNLEWIFGAVGSRLTKNFTDIDLVGNGSTGRLSGFYFSNGNQHLDHDTQQNHMAPNTTSDLLFKGALSDRSRSVWQGMISVAPGAQKSDGYQSNLNLVLSDKARADSIPGLEIMADDVRCSHGTTVGNIDPNEVFYLQTRGISELEAEQLIVEGFFDPIMNRIPFEGVRMRFKKSIVDKLKRNADNKFRK